MDVLSQLVFGGHVMFWVFARLRGLVILTSLIDLTRAITSYTKDPALVFFELCVTVKWLYMLIHSPVFRGRRAYYVLAY